MPYTKTNWTDEVPSTTPLRFRIKLPNGTILADNAEIELVTPVTPGVPVNATNLNKIEQGIADAFAGIEAVSFTPMSAMVSSVFPGNHPNEVDLTQYGVPETASVVLVYVAIDNSYSAPGPGYQVVIRHPDFPTSIAISVPLSTPSASVSESGLVPVKNGKILVATQVTVTASLFISAYL